MPPTDREIAGERMMDIIQRNAARQLLEAAAEIERLEDERRVLNAGFQGLSEQLAAAVLKIERLRAARDAAMRVHVEDGAEIERLRAALQRVADLVDSEADEPLDDAIAIARRALAPKPMTDKLPQMKDERPKLGLWVPGNYECLCDQCHNRFIGDKRAIWCADCAYEEQR